MSLKIDRVQLEIQIGSDKARLKLREIEDALKANTRELNRLSRANKTNTEEYKQLEAATKQLRVEYDKSIESIGLLNLSKKELSARARELRAILSNLSPKSDAYISLNKQLEAVDGRLAQLSKRGVDTRTSMQRLADGFNRYQAIGATMTAFFAAMVYGAGQFISSLSEMSDVLSNVAKNTDLSSQEVRDLKKELDGIKTRTTSKELMDIASEAGKLGIAGKKEIADFVRQSNEVVVAFGKDIGGNAEETINTLGKVIGAYRLNTVMGWGDAMKYIGSVINELGKQGTASEANIVEYLNRLSSTGVSLKVTADNIAGIGATLDGLKINAERGSTATGKFMMSLVSKSKEMAKFLGISQKQYQQQVEKDLLGTMMQVLKVANSGNTGLFEMVKQMDAMDVSGVYMLETVMALSNNVDVLQENLSIANAEMKSGQSIMKEYNVVNNNFAGRIEKANKQVVGFVYGLQSGLEPAILAVVEGTASLVGFVERNAKAIGFLLKMLVVGTTAFFSYTAAMKLAALWTQRATAATLLETVAKKASAVADTVARGTTILLAAAKALLTGNIERASAAMRLFNTVTKLNPVGLLVSVLTMAIGTWIAYKSTVEDTIDSHQNLVESFANERAEMELGFARLKMYKEGTLQRSKAIEDINSKYGKYLSNLITEKSTIQDIAVAQKEALVGLERKLAFEIRLADIRSTMQQAYELEKKMAAARQEYLASVKNTPVIDGTQRYAISTGYDPNLAIVNASKTQEKLKIKYGQIISDLEKVKKKKDLLFSGLLTEEIDNSFTSGADNLSGKSIEELRTILLKLEEDLKKADFGSARWKQLRDDIKKTKKAIKDLSPSPENDKKFDLAGKSIWELRDILLKLQADLENADFGSARWKSLRDDVETTKKAIEDFGIAVKGDKFVMPKLGMSGKDSISEARGTTAAPAQDKEAAYILEQYKKTIAGRQALNLLEYQQGLISHAEYLDKKKVLDKEYEDGAHAKKMELINTYWSSAQNLMSAYSQYQNNLMNRELEAAGNNEAKKAAIKRKYAKREQNMAILTAMVNQALGISDIWSKWAHNPIVAGTLTGIELLATGLQIAAIKSKQFYTGRYDVTGATDGRTYRNVPYVGQARTGIVRHTALVAERGSEGIVDHKTLYSRQRDHQGMTAMDHFRAISALRYTSVSVPQYATGRYPNTATTTSTSAPNFVTRDELATYMATQIAYMQQVAAWQSTFEVRNDPRSTLEEYDNYKAIENRARG